jgi:hypothetical protein
MLKSDFFVANHFVDLLPQTVLDVREKCQQPNDKMQGGTGCFITGQINILMIFPE